MIRQKIKVTFTLNSGAKIEFKCARITINKNDNKITSYTVEGLDKKDGDPIFYVKLESIDHISFRKVFW